MPVRNIGFEKRRTAGSLPVCAAIVAAILVGCASTAPTDGPYFGYQTFDQALDDVMKQPGVEMAKMAGWVVLWTDERQTRWTFTAANHPAHPTVQRRIVTPRQGPDAIDSQMVCMATQVECEKIELKFNQIDRLLEQREIPDFRPEPLRNR